MKKEYNWHAQYTTINRYRKYAQLKSKTKEDAIEEVKTLPNFQRLNEVYRRAVGQDNWS